MADHCMVAKSTTKKQFCQGRVVPRLVLHNTNKLYKEVCKLTIRHLIQKSYSIVTYRFIRKTPIKQLETSFWRWRC